MHQKDTKYVYWMLFLLLISSTGLALNTATSGSDQTNLMAPRPQSEEIKTIQDSFNLEFENIWVDAVETHDEKTIPDITAIVDEIPTFIQDGLSVYNGSEIPSMTFDKRHYRLTATYLWVYYDHDTFGAGDMFLKGWVNQQIDDQMSYTEDWRFDLGQFDDNDHGPINCLLFDGWAYDLSFQIELFDDDAGICDSFGTWEQYYYDYTHAGTININYNDDAVVQFVLEIIEGPTLATAGDILDAYKPYLYSDVETVYDDPAEYVFGRIIEGYDSRIGRTAQCLQYLFYFPYEFSGTDVFIHNWDWEMILIYLDFSTSRFPYRLVWDNGFYFSSGSGYDWIDGQDYRIYEQGATPGSYSMEVEFNQYLWPLLGQKRTMQYAVYDLASVYTLDFEKWGFFEWGMPTFQATIETSYHQFDLGDAGGTDPMDMNRNYAILPMSDSIIREMYYTLNTSWEYGIHEVNGHYTPNCAPFSWDVSQPFTRPYILNNYPKLCLDINAYNGASDAKQKWVEIKKNVTTTLDVPCTLSLDVPTTALPGEQIDTDLNFHLDKSRATLTLKVDLSIVINASLGFWSYEWQTDLSQSVVLHIGTKTLEFVGDLLNFQTEIDDFTFEGIELGAYCDITGSISADLLGTIASLEFSIYLDEILKAFIGPTYAWIVDALVDDICFTINPEIVGYLSMDVAAGGSTIVDDAQFTMEDQVIPVSFIMPSSDTQEVHLEITDIKYGVNFQINWIVSINWSFVTGLFLDNYEINLGTWPIIAIDLAEGTASLTTVATYNYNATQGCFVLTNSIGSRPNIPDSEDPDSPKGDPVSPEEDVQIASFPLAVIGFIGITTSMLLILKKRK
jgi:hypothetical protein